MDQGVIDSAVVAGDPAGERFDLRITGIHCASCVGRIERAAASVPGVRVVSVNLASERASIVAAPGIDLPAVAEAIRKVGYEAILPEQAPRPRPPSRDGLAAATALALAGLLLLPMLLMPFGIDASLSPPMQLALAAIVQFGLGARFYRDAWKA